jgi:hypothetical protein
MRLWRATHGSSCARTCLTRLTAYDIAASAFDAANKQEGSAKTLARGVQWAPTKTRAGIGRSLMVELYFVALVTSWAFVVVVSELRDQETT